MAVILGSLLVELLLALVTFLYLLYWGVNRKKNYWIKRGVFFIKKEHLGQKIGSKQTPAEHTLELYKQLGQKRFAGYLRYGKPAFLIREPDLVHKVMVKDFIYFQARGELQINSYDPLTANLFFLSGQAWRSLRLKLIPTFSAGKLKGMFEQVSKCGDNLIEKIETISKDDIDVESKNLLFEFSLAVTASCAFGLEFDGSSSEFQKFKSAVENVFSRSPLRVLRFIFVFVFPKLGELFRVRVFPKCTGDYFVNLTKATLKYRKENNVQRNDYFQLLLNLKEQEEKAKDTNLTEFDTGEEDKVVDQMQYTEPNSQYSSSVINWSPEESICANTFIFLLAGSESSAGVITLALFQLAQHQSIQHHLQQEVDHVLAKHGGCWTYETIKDMTYLDQVVQETLRFYPALPLITRECTQPYQVPDSNLVLEKGMIVAVPVMGIHMDPQHYPHPEIFKPERFEGNNFKSSSVYLPFGDGPRICVGMRFAAMQIKTCVARVVSEYVVRLSPKTQLPLQFDHASVLPTPKHGLWLRFDKRKKT